MELSKCTKARVMRPSCVSGGRNRPRVARLPRHHSGPPSAAKARADTDMLPEYLRFFIIHQHELKRSLRMEKILCLMRDMLKVSWIWDSLHTTLLLTQDDIDHETARGAHTRVLELLPCAGQCKNSCRHHPDSGTRLK